MYCLPARETCDVPTTRCTAGRVFGQRLGHESQPCRRSAAGRPRHHFGLAHRCDRRERLAAKAQGQYLVELSVVGEITGGEKLKSCLELRHLDTRTVIA